MRGTEKKEKRTDFVGCRTSTGWTIYCLTSSVFHHHLANSDYLLIFNHHSSISDKRVEFQTNRKQKEWNERRHWLMTQLISSNWWAWLSTIEFMRNKLQTRSRLTWNINITICFSNVSYLTHQVTTRTSLENIFSLITKIINRHPHIGWDFSRSDFSSLTSARSLFLRRDII